jgi:hypothetical protein
MSINVEEFLAKALKERERQKGLPGSEWDHKNSPGDWVALITHYVSEEVRRNGVAPSKEYFEETLIKAFAVIIAAWEHIEVMHQRDQLR